MTQPAQQRTHPGTEAQMTPKPAHGEGSHKGCDKLVGRAAVITGGDSGIGRAGAITYAREGADVLTSCLNEHEDARETARWVEQAGRRCVPVPGDIADAAHCRAIIQRAVDEFGRVDIPVDNAAVQMTHDSPERVSDEGWERTFAINTHARFYLTEAALPHMKLGSSIVDTSSVNSGKAPPKLIAYPATEAAVADFTAGLGQLVAGEGIRVNRVAPGRIWTPPLPSTMPSQQVESFGREVPMERPGRPKEVATLSVFLAPDDASHVTGARFAVIGGTPVL